MKYNKSSADVKGDQSWEHSSFYSQLIHVAPRYPSPPNFEVEKGLSKAKQLYKDFFPLQLLSMTDLSNHFHSLPIGHDNPYIPWSSFFFRNPQTKVQKAKE